jgi:hypothetical protein
MRTHLVSISEAARQLGHDWRTVQQVAKLAEVKVITNTGGLYSLDEIRHLLMAHKPHLLGRTVRSHMVRKFVDI